MSDRPPITPDTKVAELLDAYPELEEILIDAAPAFAKLKNPVLRRTIARVASLKRAAEVGGISSRDLVLRLREAAGMTTADGDLAEIEAGAGETDGPAPWVDPARVRWTVNADALLEAGGQPIAEVQAKARTLEWGDLGLIRSSFRPGPLIEMLENKGFRTTVLCTDGSFATFVGRTPELGCSGS